MKTFIKQMLSHKGRMYEVFYWSSRLTNWIPNNKFKKWIDKKEFGYWSEWVNK